MVPLAIFHLHPVNLHPVDVRSVKLHTFKLNLVDLHSVFCILHSVRCDQRLNVSSVSLSFLMRDYQSPIDCSEYKLNILKSVIHVSENS